MKRGFFVFEPLIVIIFIAAVATASFVTLSEAQDKLSKPLGQHANTLVKSYLSAETDLFLEREMMARYSIEDAVYKLASSAGTDQISSGVCVGVWDKQSTLSYVKTEIPEMNIIADNFEEIVRREFKSRTQKVPYDYIISVHKPFIVTGVPLAPDQIEIPLIPLLVGEPFEGGILSYYHPRVSFTARYNYPLEETYDEIRKGLKKLSDKEDRENCRTIAPGEAKDDCVSLLTESFNSDILSWTAQKDSEKEDDYLLDITHLYKMPFCENSPLTKIRISLPTGAAASED